jgi:hypothetical protein
MKWGIPPSVMERLEDRVEIWAHWQYRNIRESQLREKAEMEAKSARGGR